MLPAKLLLTVTSLGLAVTVPTAIASSLRVRVHTRDATCGDGQQSIGVAGWDHDGCVDSGYVCVDDVSDGHCPDGAHCELLETGVYGCKDGAPPHEETISYPDGCADGEQTIGVAGWDHDGCIDSDHVCVAQVSDGDCPEGSYCALLDTGVYGCTAGYDDGESGIWYGSEETEYHGYCADGEQTIGVAGWDHDGCIDSDHVCVAQVSDGDCPDGSYCTLLETGVYGCSAGYEDVVYTDDGTCGEGEQTIGVVGWDHDGCIDSDHVCVAQVSNGDCPAGSYCTLLDTGVYGCQADALKKHHKKHHKASKVTCPSGQQSIGVAGWSQDGCVASGNVCVANTYGSCPSGAHCEWLDTGVYGCADGAEESTPWIGCSDNEETIGVVGWEYDGCIDSDHVCVAQVSDGDCPAGSYCTLLDTGVYGCQADALKKHHKKHHKVHHHHHKSRKNHS
ncbi:hypothetical protein PHYBOEH_000561 [Phytophthora boehmeriae]|uniref:Uncharacterized protein n=1 Tax=Phytophthora boehmeriae TaxID=109152 RepID=A0A8T1VAE0_9STRA|nr:hypothetical protein PHYBOEH_000561 [Phytophthora boehmeriae]